MDFVQRQTVHRYGYLWPRIKPPHADAIYHYRKVKPLLPPNHLKGWALDAGCGPGIDAWHMAQENTCRIVAVELTPEGVTQTQERTRGFPSVHPVRANVEALPFSQDTFDFVYSYGVLHHLVHPEAGLREMVRTLKPKGLLALYVYENFQTHSGISQRLLRMVSVARRWTVRCPPGLLFFLCQMAAPLVFVGFTLPYRGLSKLRWTKSLSERIPFRHANGPSVLVEDLYDRFSAPLEKRYNRPELQQALQSAGLTDIHVVPLRGWVAYGYKG